MTDINPLDVRRYLPVRTGVISRPLSRMPIAIIVRAEAYTRYALLTASRGRIGIRLRIANMVLLKGVATVDGGRGVSRRAPGRVRDIVVVLVRGVPLVVRVRVERGAGVVEVVRIRMGAESRVVVVLGVVGHHHAVTGHDAAVAVVLHLVVVEGGGAGHGVVGAQTSLATVDDNVKDDAGDVGNGPDHGEGEEGFVDAADGDAGRVRPEGGVAGCRDRAGHAPAEEGEANEPDNEEDGVEGEREARGQAGGAVRDGSEDVVKEGEN